MLHVFKARESVDKEKFIYENINGKTFVLVPNQYTLVAEEQALRYTNSACLLDIEILSLSRLGQRILSEQGKENIDVLNRFGRYMMLYQIIRKHKDDLDIFGATSDSNSFIDLVHDFIADFKQQDCRFEELELMIDENADTIFGKKLAELDMILREYEEQMHGKYTDAENYINLFISCIKEAKIIQNHVVWLYGFDSLTPKYIDALVEMAKRTEVNVVVNESDFGLHESVIGAVRRHADNNGVSLSVETIDAVYTDKNCATMDFLEQNLFKPFVKPIGTKPAKEQLNNELKLVECANPFYESESAAAYVYELIRDYEYKMNEIVIICNDESRRPIIDRTFEEYGINLFVDARKTITDSIAARFIVSALEFVEYNYRANALFMLLKTGLIDIEPGDIELLENYARNYNIRGNMWAKEFKYGLADYGDKFAKIEETRALIMESVSKLVNLSSEAKSLEEFIYEFEQLLENEWRIPDKLEALANKQENDGFNEEAQNTRESYEACINTLKQLREVLGNEEFDLKEMLELYKKGLESVDIGVIPPSLDGIAIGPMIRTRPRPPKALIILGANEGILPMEPSTEGLFSIDEKAMFADKDFALGHLDELQMTEENVAMYRMIAKPSEKLYVSWSLSDTEGNDTKSSTLVDTIRSLLPEIEVSKDLVSRGFGMDLINNDEETLRHLLNYLKGRKSQEAPTDEVAAEKLSNSVIAWMEENSEEEFEAVMTAARNDNKPKNISKNMAERLFASRDGNFSFSASRLERYFSCPFNHFVKYGLKPEEKRAFQVDNLEIGNLYHDSLMEISRELEEQNRWKTVSSDEIRDMVHKIMERLAGDYRGGLFIADKREEYHLGRIKAICTEVAMQIVNQITSGKIEKSYFEEQFGRGKTFKAVELELNDRKIFIEGKIDRVDVFEGGDARVVDYKTSKHTVDINQMRVGYQMQLMVYMQGVKTGDYTPAGIFYYNIKDINKTLKNTAPKTIDECVQEEREKAYKMTGLFIDEDKVVNELPLNMVESSSKNQISREDFEKLESEVREALSKTSEAIINGDIEISPTFLKKGKKTKACANCDYKSICRFDRTYKGNRYREI